jgi:hypothetical protein
MALNRAEKINSYLLERSDRMEEDCVICLDKKARHTETRYVYETPWDDQDTGKLFCSEECADVYLYEGDFSYFWCEPCQRDICERHPANGWQVQYRMVDDEQTCLRCYQDYIFENGVEREKVESGEIPGMFFSYGNSEPKEAGYSEISGFSDYFISDSEKADRLRKKALELMDDCYKVVIGYERLAIGGSEGYVTLMAKKFKPEREESSDPHET